MLCARTATIDTVASNLFKHGVGTKNNGHDDAEQPERTTENFNH